MKIIFKSLLYFLFISQLYAPARMHTNTIIYPTGHKYETKEKYEICRLKKEIRKPTEIKCFYLRQDKNGSELIITNDQPTFSCLKQIDCKRE
ncbi:hypothetical protein OA264_03520 [Alphaproteobacteria bacterium]|nr:hypothetical protein [Alphaproteobacteria bacterium]